VFRHPVASFTAPFRRGTPASDADRSAASSSEGLVVTCFIRASFEPLPRAWKAGGLHLTPDGARWAPGIRLRGGGTLLPSPLRVQRAREVEGSEELHVKARFFQIIEATSDDGDLLLGVPRDSVALVVERLTGD
jgi:hypothetical protein